MLGTQGSIERLDRLFVKRLCFLISTLINMDWGKASQARKDIWMIRI